MTEREMYAAVKQWLQPPEWAVLPQVRNQTGFARTVRTADAIAVQCFPSKGIGVHGFEFKNSRSDWLRELKDGAKGEEIGRFCAQWSVVASAPDIVKADEVPTAWGWVVIVDGAVRVKKKAPVREADEPTWRFFAALMRAATESIPEAEVERRVKEAVVAEQNRAWQEFEKEREAERKRDREAERSAWAKLRAFEEASGVRVDTYGADSGRRIGEAVRFVLNGGFGNFGGLMGARNTAARFVEDVDKIMAEARPQPQE